VHERATLCRKDLNGIIVHQDPSEGPGEEVDPLVVVALSETVRSVATVVVQQVSGIGCVVVDKARDAMHALVLRSHTRSTKRLAKAHKELGIPDDRTTGNECL
jgi:hypothetical protein